MLVFEVLLIIELLNSYWSIDYNYWVMIIRLFITIITDVGPTQGLYWLLSIAEVCQT